MFGVCDNDYGATTHSSKDMEAQKSSGCTSIQEVSVVAESLFLYWSNEDSVKREVDTIRSRFLEHIPYTKHSTYYTSTYSKDVLKFVQENYLDMDSDEEKRKKKFAILRPFCAFDAGSLTYTFDVWNEFPPCDLDENERMLSADLFLSFSQTYFNEEAAVRSVNVIIQIFYSGEYRWSKCFQNVYAVETNIEADKDNFIPPMQEYLFDWINGPNRQFERGFRLMQSSKWGDYETFYLMEGDSIPVRANWLPALLDDLEEKRPFAILGSNFEISIPKWGDFNKDYKSTDQIEPFKKYKAHGNVVYNTSHPLLDAFVDHLEVEAHSPYNSVPFFIRLVQLLREGKYGEVAQIPPSLLLDDEGKNITLSNNTAMLHLKKLHEEKDLAERALAEYKAFEDYQQNERKIFAEKLLFEMMRLERHLVQLEEQQQERDTAISTDMNVQETSQELIGEESQEEKLEQLTQQEEKQEKEEEEEEKEDIQESFPNDPSDLKTEETVEQQGSYQPPTIPTQDGPDAAAGIEHVDTTPVEPTLIEEEKPSEPQRKVQLTKGKKVKSPPSLTTLHSTNLMVVFEYLDAIDILNMAQTCVKLYSKVDGLFGLGGTIVAGSRSLDEDDYESEEEELPAVILEEDEAMASESEEDIVACASICAAVEDNVDRIV